MPPRKRKPKGLVIDELWPELSLNNHLNDLIRASSAISNPEAKDAIVKARDLIFSSYCARQEK